MDSNYSLRLISAFTDDLNEALKTNQTESLSEVIKKCWDSAAFHAELDRPFTSEDWTQINEIFVLSLRPLTFKILETSKDNPGLSLSEDNPVDRVEHKDGMTLTFNKDGSFGISD